VTISTARQTPAHHARRQLISWLSQDLLVASTDALGLIVTDLVELSLVAHPNAPLVDASAGSAAA